MTLIHESYGLPVLPGSDLCTLAFAHLRAKEVFTIFVIFLRPVPYDLVFLSFAKLVNFLFFCNQPSATSYDHSGTNFCILDKKGSRIMFEVCAYICQKHFLCQKSVIV